MNAKTSNQIEKATDGGAARPPILLDVGAEFDVLDEEEAFFKDMGVEVIRCLGPETANGCPVLEGNPCPKVARADVILCQLDLDTPDHRLIFESYRRHPELVAVVSPEESQRWSAELRGIDTVIGPPSPARLAEIAKSCLQVAGSQRGEPHEGFGNAGC